MGIERATEEVQRLCTVSELASYLNVPNSTVYYWKSQGKITPAIDTGRTLRFITTQVLKELSQQKPVHSCNSLENVLDSYGVNRSLKTRNVESPSPRERD